MNICSVLTPLAAASCRAQLRDLARVFQGVLRADPKLCAAQTDVLALLVHENLRVFQDRMVNAEDRGWFRDLIDKQLAAHFGTSWHEVAEGERLIFGDFLKPGADVRQYARVTDVGVLQRVVEEALEDFNNVSNKPMRLVMFADALEHVARVCRVIRLPLGNALLLGVGGSGRQSLTRLAAHLEEFTLFQIEVAKGYGVNEWRDDLRKVLLMAGVEGKDVVFLFTDTQIVQESFLEDINNILNRRAAARDLFSRSPYPAHPLLLRLPQCVCLPVARAAARCRTCGSRSTRRRSRRR